MYRRTNGRTGENEEPLWEAGVESERAYKLP
jgi:hypothetical protein